MTRTITLSAVVALLLGSVAFGSGNIMQFQDWTGIIGEGRVSTVPPTVQWNGVGVATSTQSLTFTDTEQEVTTPFGTTASQSVNPVLRGFAGATGTAPGAALTSTVFLNTSGIDENGAAGSLPPGASGQEQSVSYGAGTIGQFQGFTALSEQGVTRTGGTGGATATNRLVIPLSQSATNAPVGAEASQDATLSGAFCGPALQTATVTGQPGNVGSGGNLVSAGALQNQGTSGAMGPIHGEQSVGVFAGQQAATQGNTGSAVTTTNLGLDAAQENNNVGAEADQQANVAVIQTGTVASTVAGGNGAVNNSVQATVNQAQSSN